MANYWFRQWMRRYRVRDAVSLSRALNNPRVRDHLITLAMEARKDQFQGPLNEYSIVAGKRLDLSTHLDCGELKCVQAEIDILFRRAWHYFDTIILPDRALEVVLEYTRGGLFHLLNQDLLGPATVVRELERVGASDFVRYEARFDRDGAGRSNENDSAVDAIDRLGEPLIQAVLTESYSWWEQETIGDHKHINYNTWFHEANHPELGTICYRDRILPNDKSELRRDIARQIGFDYARALEFDLRTAQRLQTTLGATSPMYRLLLPTAASPDVNQVAFDLHLPYAADCDVKALMRFRREERESFERFQYALRSAIVARSSDQEANPRIAAEIRHDVIDPELRNIRDRLAAAKHLAVRTGTSGVLLGSVTAAIGLLTPLQALPFGPAFVAGGAITLGAASVNKALQDYWTSRRDVSLSNMYFLWAGPRKSFVPASQNP